MELEEHKVLLQRRWNLLEHHGKKEWWYTGVYDPESGIYLGFSVIRVALIDSIQVALYDLSRREPVVVRWKGYLSPQNPPGQLCLQALGKRFSFDYRGSAALGWHCHIQADGFAADLRMRPNLPAFTKFDNRFDHQYSLLHFFGNTVEGFVHTRGKEYRFRNALGYYDHCFGKVPSRSRWHWIAVQSQEFALASLMNYGASGQCYTQCFSRSGSPRELCDRWMRLDQDVSFEYDTQARWEKPWRLTSPDMDLELAVLQHSSIRERVPPLLPLLISLEHHECYVKVRGKLRLDGKWLHTGDLYGVLEEHHGRW